MTAPVAEVDALARRLMIRLADETPLAPPLESIVDNERSVAPVQRSIQARRGRRSFVAAVASIVAVAAGLGWLTQLRTSEPTATLPPTARQLPAVVPDGWVLDRVLGPGTFVDTGRRPDMELFASAASPLGPVVAIDQLRTGPVSNGENVVETSTSDGRPVVLSDSYIRGLRILDIRSTPQTWITLNARNIDDETLIRLAESATAGADGFATLDPTAIEQAGLEPVGGGTLTSPPFRAGVGSDLASIPAGATVTSYSSPNGPDIELKTYPSSPYHRAALALLLGPRAAAGDPDGWFVVNDDMASTTGWYVERNGYAHVILGQRATRDAMRQILESLRPVDDIAWDRLAAADVQEQAPATTIRVDVTSRPASPATGARREIETRVEAIGDGRYRLALVDPDGKAAYVGVSFTGRQLTVTPDDPTLAALVVGHDIGNVQGPSTAASYSSLAALTVVALPSTSEADHVGIAIDGTNYTVEPLQIDERYPISIAVLLVAPGTGSDPQITLIADGQTIDTL